MERKLSAKELMVLNCDIGEVSWGSLGQQGDPTSPKGNQPWKFIGRTDGEAEAPINTLATWCKELTHLKRPWRWEKLKAGGEGDDRGWHGWMALPTQGTWICVDSRLVMDKEVCLLPFMGSQELNMTEELNWTEVVEYIVRLLSFFSFGFLWFCFDGQEFCFSLNDIPLWM